MPYLTELIHEGTGLLRLGRGVLTGQEILDVIAAFPEGISTPERITHCLVDLTGVTRLEVSNRELEAIVATDSLKLKGTNLTRAAIAAPEDLTYGVSNMYRGHASHSGIEIRVFRTLAEAKAWLCPDGTAKP
ncbi:MAG: hypothetical protein HXX12_15520 [Geothrix sp.]|uniref:hypothetical protein n=1 Tax=Geothrix sp. TaxID=1962974 RepID=UPI0018376ECF|nr:hypothetical protein [Geothrix sp.]NWJ42369.1 hypothetical protein [Geothrix sp.]WIL19664.1 MAG: hypothetical protein QOZ81_002191 [Geothrix sp.]